MGLFETTRCPGHAPTPILLCDEPFSALDKSTAGRLRAELVRLVKEHGKTAVFITRSTSEALQIGDRIVVQKRPATIAYDVGFDVGTGEEERELIASESVRYWQRERRPQTGQSG